MCARPLGERQVLTTPRPHDAARQVVVAAEQAGRADALEYQGLGYVRLADEVGGLPRGTVIVGGHRVPVYPSIGRIFALERGVRRNFAGPFEAEEKIDGYNVRIIRSDGRIVAFTRGGFLCPFTTDRLPDLVDLNPLFDADPGLVVCGEIAGPGNPYIHVPCSHVELDVGFFAFDIMHVDREGFLPLDTRDALFERFGVPRAPRVGRFTAETVDALREAVLRLDALRVEGVVLKPPVGDGLRVKWVTPTVNLSDVVEDAGLLAELPPAFFTSRLLRLVIAMDELGLWDRRRILEERLGRGIVRELRRAITEVREQGVVARNFTVRLRDASSADALLGHLNRSSRSVKVMEIERRPAAGYYLLTFRKTYLQSTSYLKTLLGGEALVD